MYHRAFIWPEDDAVARRLKADPDFSEEKRLAEMHRFRREVTGLTLSYQHVLKVINCDQPNADVYLQGTDAVAMSGEVHHTRFNQTWLLTMRFIHYHHVVLTV